MPPKKTKKVVRIVRKSKALIPCTPASETTVVDTSSTEPKPSPEPIVPDKLGSKDPVIEDIHELDPSVDPEPEAEPKPEPKPEPEPELEPELEPEPETETETDTELKPSSGLDAAAVGTAIYAPAFTEDVSKKVPSLPPVTAEALGADLPETISAESSQKPGPKTTIRVRKVLRKKFVKKLVPKGCLAAKNVKGKNIQSESAAGLPGTSLSLNHVANVRLEHEGSIPEIQMKGEDKFVPIEADIVVEGKEECDIKQARSDVLVSRNDGDGLETVNKHEVEGMSERMKRRKSEIFVGGLDRDAKEEDLRSVFGKVGEILEVRMMIDGQSGKNKGYAFLRYAEPSFAKRAVAELAKVEICGKVCGTAAVQGNDTIFLGNIDKTWKKEDVIKLLQEVGIENIDTVRVLVDPNNADVNRGFAFLELETNADAQRAYKKLQKKDVFGKGRNIKVAWADSFIVPDEEEMQKVKSVYAEGIPDSWNEDKLKETFKKFGEIERVVLGRNIKTAKRRDFAFINYANREAALSCIESLSNDVIEDDGSKVNLKVALAKRVHKVKPKNVGQNSANNSSLNEKFKPLQRVLPQDYSPTVQGQKRTFSALGDSTLHSDFNGYPRARLDSSFGIPGSSYGMTPSGGIGSSLAHNRQPILPSGYPLGSSYGSGRYANSYLFRQGAPPYMGSLGQRYQL
ncbi:hypothetical protein HPP92_015124 [Vanilla planifolia]|uniref:RRM domain-containing protein n=1 Tax=Vanilla planifolia TaxID=51239 RepID=A0A835QPJ8_VANPL|nr:hypothetical protein HPP92_015124 [Vanilla planifolia]